MTSEREGLIKVPRAGNGKKVVMGKRLQPMTADEVAAKRARLETALSDARCRRDESARLLERSVGRLVGERDGDRRKMAVQMADEITARHIAGLHAYNEIRDLAKALLAKCTDLAGERIAETNARFDAPES
ncbi:hypothetical protein PYCC9005_000916 [Savitreella phatthalungensis]